MAIDWCKVARFTSIVFGGYVISSYILAQFLRAHDHWEIIGYINGLVRYSGDATTAANNLTEWGNYWKGQAPSMSWLIDYYLNYGTNMIAQVYGTTSSITYH